MESLINYIGRKTYIFLLSVYTNNYLMKVYFFNGLQLVFYDPTKHLGPDSI